MKFIILILAIVVDPSSQTDLKCLTKTRNGEVQGIVENNYCAFKGVPYAEKPVEEKRFEPSMLLKSSWEGVLNTTAYSDVCLQWNHFLQDNGDYLVGSEDCLYLNVFTKSVNQNALQPVFVYFHGGAFMYGSGDFFKPKYLLESKDVIFVSINYRLGSLGFLSTENHVVPGNMGMKDQNLALRWIKENIQCFGGNPGNIILMGMSAGGASVHLHYLSKLSSGLFHGGIAHSGAATNSWVLVENSLQRAKKLASAVNCTTVDEEEMVKCLKTVPGNILVRNSKELQPWRYAPFSPFGIVVEKDSDGAFLTDSPANIIIGGDFNKVPIIFLFTEREGLYPAADYYNSEVMSDLDQNWNKYLPHILHFNDTINETAIAFTSQEIRQHYLGNEKLSKENFDKLADMIGDRLFKYDIFNVARLQANDNGLPKVYLVYYRRTGLTDSVSNYLAKRYDIAFGSGHGDDFMMFLDNAMHPQLTPDERRMGEKFIEMYATLATSEIPKFGETELRPIEVDEEEISYLDVLDNDEIGFKKSSDIGQYAFWKQIPFAETVY